jgi:hypothetical protein
MNYASMFQTPVERHNAFKLARDLYDLRSSVAHGANVEEKVIKLAGESMSLYSAAEMARSVLRQVLCRFLPEGESPAYAQRDYWRRVLLGDPGPIV